MNCDISKLVVIGINHNTSSIAEREVYQINKKDLKKSLINFIEMPEVEGIVIVSTCNRLEFYLTVKKEVNPFLIVTDFYLNKAVIKTSLNKNLFYVFDGIDAVVHLFKVTAGLDSMLLGEYQVQGQIKDAYSLACSEKTADKILHKLFHAAFRVGKAIRYRTKIGSANQSLSGAACRLIKDKISKADFITIVGVNQNTKIVADNLSKAGFNHLFFVNRTFAKARELAERYDAAAFGMDNIEEAIKKSSCLFSCTGAPGFIIHSKLINGIVSKNSFPKFIVDMAVPRDINPEGLSSDVELIDLEGLKKYLADTQKEITLDIPEAVRIISNEASIFEVWNESQVDDDTALLMEKLEMDRLQLLDEMRLQVLPNEQKLLDKFSRSMLHRMKSVIIQTAKTKTAEVKI